MNRAIVISAIVLVAVIMGMSALAPASAASPPSDPRAGENPPEVDECEEIANSDLPQRVKDRLSALAGC